MTLYLTGEPSSFDQQGGIPAQLNRMDFLRRRDYRDNLRFYYGFQWPVQRINQTRVNLYGPSKCPLLRCPYQSI